MVESYIFRAPWAPMPSEFQAAVLIDARRQGVEPNKIEIVLVARPEDEKELDWLNDFYRAWPYGKTFKFKPLHLARVIIYGARL